MIHTFGDSHAVFGFQHIKMINIHTIGPILCYTFGKNKLNGFNIKNYGVNENDTIIFCLGEIDCRAHIYRFVNEINTYETIIDNVVENYFEAIKQNKDQYKNLNVFVYNIVPPTNVLFMHTLYEYETHILTKEQNHIPWKGSNEDRMKYHLYFNKKLEEYCLKYNFVFFNIYNNYCDENGFLKREFSDGNVHINNPLFIEEFIKNNIKD